MGRGGAEEADELNSRCHRRRRRSSLAAARCLVDCCGLDDCTAPPEVCVRGCACEDFFWPCAIILSWAAATCGWWGPGSGPARVYMQFSFPFSFLGEIAASTVSEFCAGGWHDRMSFTGLCL
jgi:hypothetical protein